MTTVYIAAEKFMTWTEEGRLSFNEPLIHTIHKHCSHYRFVLYFAPKRFGLLFQEKNELEKAWQYMNQYLKRLGFVAQDVFLFDEDIEIQTFKTDIEHQKDEMPLVFSDAKQDDILCQTLQIRKVSEIPCLSPHAWEKTNVRSILRSILSAALHT